jgi:acyl carrier protein phosphodiesterase
MNYLAHIFLSDADRKKQIGNFIGDAVKGNSYNNYPPPIANGILLHRAIDVYTDNHPAIKEMVRLLRPHFGRYSGILLDIYLDYLLASRFDKFSAVPLKRFARGFYLALICNRRYLPGRIKSFMWHFITTNRLYKYASTSGIKDSLNIMVRVHRIDISVDLAISYLIENEDELFTRFLPFFEELQAFCRQYSSEKLQPCAI